MSNYKQNKLALTNKLISTKPISAYDISPALYNDIFSKIKSQDFYLTQSPTQFNNNISNSLKYIRQPKTNISIHQNTPQSVIQQPSTQQYFYSIKKKFQGIPNSYQRTSIRNKITDSKTQLLPAHLTKTQDDMHFKSSNSDYDLQEYLKSLSQLKSNKTISIIKKDKLKWKIDMIRDPDKLSQLAQLLNHKRNQQNQPSLPTQNSVQKTNPKLTSDVEYDIQKLNQLHGFEQLIQDIFRNFYQVANSMKSYQKAQKIFQNISGFNETIASLFVCVDKPDTLKQTTGKDVIQHVYKLMLNQSNVKYDIENSFHLIQLLEEISSKQLVSKLVYFNRNLLNYIEKRENELGRIQQENMKEKLEQIGEQFQQMKKKHKKIDQENISHILNRRLYGNIMSLGTKLTEAEKVIGHIQVAQLDRLQQAKYEEINLEMKKLKL